MPDDTHNVRYDEDLEDALADAAQDDALFTIDIKTSGRRHTIQGVLHPSEQEELFALFKKLLHAPPA